MHTMESHHLFLDQPRSVGGRAGFVIHLLHPPPSSLAEVLPPSTTGGDCVWS